MTAAEANVSSESDSGGRGQTCLLISFLVVSSLSLKLAFNIKRRDNARFARTMHLDHWFIQHRKPHMFGETTYARKIR